MGTMTMPTINELLDRKGLLESRIQLADPDRTHQIAAWQDELDQINVQLAARVTDHHRLPYPDE